MPQPNTYKPTQATAPKYLLHNLIVESTLNLHPLKAIKDPELALKKADILISLANIDNISTGNFSRKLTSSDDCWIDIPTIAKFHIQSGNSIKVDPHTNTQMQSVLLYLFGSIMAICLYQRGLLVLHANAIEIGGTAVLLAGNSGAGKSTTAAIFHKKGFKVLSDDIVVLDKNVHAMGGFPQIKLFQNTLDELDISNKNLTPIAAQKGKFSFPLTQNHKQIKRTISAVYILSTAKGNSDCEFLLSPIQGVQRFKKLIENTYRNELIEGLNIKDHHLNLCARLSKKIHMMSIVRPTSYFNGYELVEKILDDLEKNTITPYTINP